MLTVNKKQSFVIGWQNYRADDLLQSIAPQQWQRLSCGHGSKGEREYEWARIEANCDHSEGFGRWLVFRRSLDHPNEPRCISYYQVFAPLETSLDTVIGSCCSTQCKCLRSTFNLLITGIYDPKTQFLRPIVGRVN